MKTNQTIWGLVILIGVLLLAGNLPYLNHAQAANLTPEAREQTLKQILPELSKGHKDKSQLGWYATSLLRKVDPAVNAFALDMEKQHKDLEKRLTTYAKAHKIELKFHYADDVVGKARAAQEKDDGDAIQAMNNTDFQRAMLVFMFADYDWQKHLIQSLLPLAKDDSELKSYLDDSLKIHNDHLATINKLLARYQYK